MASNVDKIFMEKALLLASKALGKTSPNPCVGAIIVKNKKIVAEGFHAKAGTDHAEVAAIKKASGNAKGADLYVTLEPCCHFGLTPPCTDAVIKAGIKRVVCATFDPNPLVNGKGISILKKAGIKVSVPFFEHEARDLNQPYFKNITLSLPYIALKTACTLDFKIADQNGKSKWITGISARRHARELRSHYDAILTGIGTVLHDDPMLSAKNKPLRIILDSKLRTPLSAKVLRDKNVLLVTTKFSDKSKYREYDILDMGDSIDIKKLLKELWRRNVRSIFVEAGEGINTSFVKAGLVDKFYFFIAPKVFGEGISAFDCLVPDFVETKQKKIGKDILFESCVRFH